jgi:uncharacterized alpha-E superfamily protein
VKTGIEQLVAEYRPNRARNLDGAAYNARLIRQTAITPDRWAVVERLYHDALARAEDKRAAFLAEACAGDERSLVRRC